MKGDFSRWDAILKQNVNGVLHQQGRVLLDRDWNDQHRLTGSWQDRTGRHVVGRGVLAVPAHAPDAFKVTEAVVDDGNVRLSLQPGTGWADGLAVELGGAPDDTDPVTRRAPYLEPPLQVPAASVDDITEGVRDAVILEVWREELHGFQRPELFIEPALGGPDTTERIHTAMRFRLFRMQPEDTCRTIASQLQDDPTLKGRLTVSLDPTTTTDGDCPTVEAGGYVGFEHALYRIEVARVDAAAPMFKWSRFNGGLVGRGRSELGGADPRVVITANDQAIKTAGRDSFYLEVVTFDAEEGYWRVTYGADVTLNGDDLEVGAVRYEEPELPTGRVFFRLWDGIAPIGDYLDTAATPNGLRDGIRLAFEAPGAGTLYRPGDYWTFNVRAGGLANDQTLIDHELPAGVEYHRVPLAEIGWNAAASVSFDAGEIADCRDRFRPLTDQKGCCTFSVGDGRRSRGDFDSIEEALRHLPAEGGQICVLPGTHRVNAVLVGRRNVRITGCGHRTLVHPHPDLAAVPLFQLASCQNIRIDHLTLFSATGTPIQLADPPESENPSQGIEILHNEIVAGVHGVEIGVQNRRAGDNDIRIEHNEIGLLDREAGGAAIVTAADDVRIARNRIVVVPAPDPGDPNDPRPPDDGPNEPFDPCANMSGFYASNLKVARFVALTLHYMAAVLLAPRARYAAAGGIHVASGSERVKIVANEIVGGAGHGITLGGLLEIPEPPDEEPEEEGHEITNDQNQIWARALDAANDESLRDVSISFEHEDGSVVTGTTDATGLLLIDAEPGHYRVYSAQPDYRVVEVETTDQGEFGVLHLIWLERIEEDDDVSLELAFIYDVTIAHNEISDMGLAGIGVPLEVAVDGAAASSRRAGLAHFLLSLLGTPVIDVTVRENHIRHCFRNPYDRTLRTTLSSRGLLGMGLGGVTLGACANLRVAGNRIEDNGSGETKPVCGVFVMYGEQIDIHHNLIRANGEPPAGGVDRLEEGIRGGVVLAASSAPLFGLLAERETERSTGRPAARIQDNVIDQPVGRALTLLALGPVSVASNHFSSAASPSADWTDRIGTVLIFNLGSLFGGTAAGVSGGEFATTRPALTRAPESRIPTGGTLFNNNQTYLGVESTSLISQFILTMSDLGFSGNQSEMHGQGGALPGVDNIAFNTVLGGDTLRATHCRFVEPIRSGRPRLSLVSSSTRMNNTVYNQGNHCIIAACTDATKLEDVGNHELNDAFCRQLSGRRGSALVLLAMILGGLR